MSDPKPFASLSSGLLARKGAARPAMRPQGFGQSGAGLEDLGWNDMGSEHPGAAAAEPEPVAANEVIDHPRFAHSLGLSPVESPVHGQQAEIADRFAAGPGSPLADDDESFDEDFDETAEIYEPEPEAALVGRPASPSLKVPALPAPSVEDYAEAAEAAEAAQADVFAAEPMDEAPAAEPDALDPFAPVQAFASKVEAALEPAPVESAEMADTVEMPQADAPVAAPAPTPVFESRVHPAVAAVVPDKAPRRAPKARSAPGLKGKAAFTLRLDPDRHLKLRLACAVNGRSAQQIVTDALDQLLAGMPELDAMAQNANRKG